MKIYKEFEIMEKTRNFGMNLNKDIYEQE
jgi:hypothetical protein